MTYYKITATASGRATVEVEADSEEAAIQKAYDEHLTGWIIDGGSAGWDIDEVEEVR